MPTHLNLVDYNYILKFMQGCHKWERMVHLLLGLVSKLCCHNQMFADQECAALFMRY